MSREAFQISSINPNDVTGGGGCACSELKVEDCHGPYVVFYANEMENPLSPHVVLGSPCIRAACAALDGEVLSAGEVMDIHPDAIVEVDEGVPGDGETEQTWGDPEVHEETRKRLVAKADVQVIAAKADAIPEV